MLARARWAATSFATYDRERTQRVVDAVAERHTKTLKGSLWRRSRRPGWASPEHKRRKNEACSRGIAERYSSGD
jgi:hypothetical protein